MNHTEKVLFFRTCGMVLWCLKHIILNTDTNDITQGKISTKLDQLIKDITNYINYLRAKEDEF